MKIYKREREHGFYYVVEEHRANVFDFKIEKETFEEKLVFVEEFLQSPHARFTHITKKEILLAFAKIDNEVAEYYRQLYPRGGSRKNAGRKQGSIQKAPKSDRTERFTLAITQQEKEFLIKQLELYRQKNK